MQYITRKYFLLRITFNISEISLILSLQTVQEEEMITTIYESLTKDFRALEE